MTRFYDNKTREWDLRVELNSWLDTPYKHWSGVKGKGVDCIHFVVRVLEATGGTQGRFIRIQKYSKDWNLHRGEEMLREGIERQLYVQKISYPKERSHPIELKENIGPGDIVLFQFGRHAAHVGIYLDGLVYQTVTNDGVIQKPWKSDFYHRVTHVYKIYEAEKI